MEQNKDRLIELCERLINVESVTGNEYDVQQEVIRIMSEIGMDIDAWEPDDAEMRACPYFAETGESFRHRPVVAGVLKGSAPARGKSLLVNGHVDVVTPEPLEKWTRWIPAITIFPKILPQRHRPRASSTSMRSSRIRKKTVDGL